MLSVPVRRPNNTMQAKVPSYSSRRSGRRGDSRIQKRIAKGGRIRVVMIEKNLRKAFPKGGRQDK